MKRLSNTLFYPSACFLIIATYYNYFVGEEYALIKPLILGNSVVLLLAYVLNTVDRYTALYFFSGTRKNMFKQQFLIVSAAANWRIMLFLSSIIFAALFGTLFFILDAGTELAGLVLLVSFLEKTIYYLLAVKNNWFSIGVNDKLIIYNNGGMKLIPFKGLKSIEKKYSELLFIFSNGQVKAIPYECVSAEELPDFLSLLEQIAQQKGAVCKW